MLKTNRLHFLITAGPTREMLDPVRFISNISTGQMGYQIAAAAKRKGFQVTLISGATCLKAPKGVRFIPVVTGKDMETQVKRHFKSCDVLIMAAAVCDYAPSRYQKNKMKRAGRKTIALRATRDILKSVSFRKGNRYVVGFCLETEALEKNAVRKLRSKNLDLIVANVFNRKHNPFGNQATSVLIIDKTLRHELWPRMSKPRLAHRLITSILHRYKNC